MRLRKFRVRGFRCVIDSNYIPAKDLVAMIGRNESGKTSMLQALVLLNKDAPIKKVDITDGLEEKVLEEGFRVVEGEFELTPDELAAIKSLAPDVPDDLKTCTIFRTATSEQPLYDFGTLTLPKVGMIRREYFPEFVNTCRVIVDKLQNIRSMMGSLANVDVVQQLKIKEILDHVPEMVERIGTHATELDLTYPSVRATHEAFAEFLELEVIDNLLKEDVVNFGRLMSLLFQEVDGVVALSDLLWRKFHPRFVYFSSYKVIHGAVKVSEYLERTSLKSTERLDSGESLDRLETIDNLFYLAKLDAREMQSLAGRIGELNKFLIKASGHLTDAIRGTWIGDETNFEAEVVYGDDVCRIKISDLHKDGTRTNQQLLQRRSEGFRWNFSFQINFNAEIRKAELKEAILLLDEPGLHLHPSQQHSFVDGIRRLSASNQILYTTHSPFMIYNFDPGHLLLVETDPQTHLGRVIESFWKGNLEGIVPIIHAMGEKHLEHRFTEVELPHLLPPVVLVERRSDAKYLRTFNTLLREPPRAGVHTYRPIDADFVPCSNLSAVVPNALYHRNLGQRAAVVFGDVPEVEPYKKFLLESKFPPRAVITVKGGELEDMIDELDYLKAVSEVYRFHLRHTKFKGVTTRMLQKARDENPEITRIVPLLEWIWSRKQKEGWGTFNREFVADKLCAQFLELGEAPQSTVGRFQELFTELGEATKLEAYVFENRDENEDEL